jgi:hypothetical protein
MEINEICYGRYATGDCACALLLVFMLLILNEHNFNIQANINLTKVFSHLYWIF